MDKKFGSIYLLTGSVFALESGCVGNPCPRKSCVLPEYSQKSKSNSEESISIIYVSSALCSQTPNLSCGFQTEQLFFPSTTGNCSYQIQYRLHTKPIRLATCLSELFKLLHYMSIRYEQTKNKGREAFVLELVHEPGDSHLYQDVYNLLLLG